MAAERSTWRRPTAFRRREVKWATYLGLVAFFLWSALGVGADPSRVLRGIGSGLTLLGDFFPPETTPRQAQRIVAKMTESVAMAMVSTVTGIAISVPVAFMAAENLSPKPLYYLNRGFISLSRALNAIIVAILVVKAVGFGPLAGVITITFKTVGFFAKLLAEDLEDIDMGSVDAVRATGASPLQTLTYGVFPQIIPRFAGLSVYRWDINVRDSTILGFVGAGGIGIQLFRAVNAFAWQSVATILIVILGVVIASEGLSAYTRRMVR